MFDIPFKADNGTEYTLTIEYEFFEDPTDPGIDMDIVRINPIPSKLHEKEIYGEWNTHVGIHETASDIAYSERGDQ